jgi:ATP-binding cassette, subfamily B, bacterial MsbA
MKDIFRILKIVFEYKRQAFASIFFNILFVIFGLVSVSASIPFLNVLFSSNQNSSASGYALNKDDGAPRDTIYFISEGDTVFYNKIEGTVLPEERPEKQLPEFKFDMDYALDIAEFYIGRVVDERGARYALFLICAFIVMTTLFKTSSRYMSLYFLAPVRNGVMRTLRNKLFGKILKLPLSYYSEERKGDIIARMSSDVQEVEVSIISTFEVVFKDPIIIIVNMFALISLSPNLTLFVVVLLPISGLLIGRLGRKLKQSAKKGQKRLGLLISIIEESITGLRIIKAFNNEGRTYGRFESVNRNYTRIMIALFRRRGLAGPLSEFLGTIVMVTVVWYGSSLVMKESSDLTPDKLIGFILLFYMIINPAKQISTAYYSIQKGLASLDRINEVLTAPVKIVDKPDAKPIHSFEQSIEFKNVSFKYDKDMVLKNINLSIRKGRTIALVGQSGSGKSTLADLVPRFIDVEDGELLIDGTNIKDYRTKEVRNLMGIVTQESILFNDSVFNNIAYGADNVDEEDVIKAAKVANAHEFITQMKYGYNTNIGDRGHKMSGGQRQRISIARAVLKNPPILILDEATSALDTESEKLVQEALFSLMKNRTSIVIAHRLSTIQNADEILVMDKGEIVERGKHSELIRHNGVYKRLVDLQNFN